MEFNATCDVICNDNCSGLVLPLFVEGHWPVWLRGLLYLVGLLYSFVGISIIADIFMGAIEKITSKTRVIQVSRVDRKTSRSAENAVESGSPDDQIEDITVSVWNATVANLTLMALGSSAPEILLSCIEIVKNGFEAGALGPGTIVGSAAFNLLVIIAVCIMAIPDGQTRRIDQIGVFVVTASCSIFAYIWLLVILRFSSPDIVTLWEALLTFIFFPLLVAIAYAVDTKCFGVDCFQWFSSVGEPSPDAKSRQLELTDDLMNGTGVENGFSDVPATHSGRRRPRRRDRIVGLIRQLKQTSKVNDADAVSITADSVVAESPHSRMWYRIGAVRDMTGGLRIRQSVSVSRFRKLSQSYGNRLRKMVGTDGEVIDGLEECAELAKNPPRVAVVEFTAYSIACSEGCGQCELTVVRSGNTESRVVVRVRTVDGTALAGEDYVPLDSHLVFEAGQLTATVTIDIIDDKQWEPDEEFFVKLSHVTSGGGDSARLDDVQIGRISVVEVTIIDDDKPGSFSFDRRGLVVKESCGEAEIVVNRIDGADGDVVVSWEAIDRSAVEGHDYIGSGGQLKFGHGETQKSILIPIVNDMRFERDENFEVRLTGVDVGGASLGRIRKLIVTISNDDEFNTLMDALVKRVHINVDRMRVSHATWMDQIKAAMTVNGGGDEAEAASASDYWLHFLTISFKVIFATIVPPASLAGGWLCFFVSLVVIGLMTAIVGDLASIFGCIVGLHDSVTAITLVALGTSLPDLFASKVAAVAEKSADNAVGNVTGSNSVNVFLGLGLPWLMAAIFHDSNGTSFVVRDPSLAFSVALYTACSAIATIILFARRSMQAAGKAELGGPPVAKIVSAIIFVGLWLLYVVTVSMRTYGVFDPPF